MINLLQNVKVNKIYESNISMILFSGALKEWIIQILSTW